MKAFDRQVETGLTSSDLNYLYASIAEVELDRYVFHHEPLGT